MARSPRTSPADYLTNGTFPNGTIDADTIDAAAANTIQTVARNVTAALNGRSVRSVATEAGLDHSAVAAFLRGEVWPDTRTIALLEQILGPIWPHTTQ